ncbi:MAG: hypothetical protein OIF57_10485 [Marinobacterium sp.]|nr:hypothetical protein [Marinobacterium sp.]
MANVQKITRDFTFRAPVDVIWPTDNPDEDRTLTLDTTFKMPEPGSGWFAADMVHDIHNLDEHFDIEDWGGKDQLLESLKMHPCCSPAFVHTFQERTQGKNIRSTG